MRHNPHTRTAKTWKWQIESYARNAIVSVKSTGRCMGSRVRVRVHPCELQKSFQAGAEWRGRQKKRAKAMEESALTSKRKSGKITEASRDSVFVVLIFGRIPEPPVSALVALPPDEKAWSEGARGSKNSLGTQQTISIFRYINRDCRDWLSVSILLPVCYCYRLAFTENFICLK